MSSSDEEDDLSNKISKSIKEVDTPEISNIDEWKDLERISRDKPLPEYAEASTISDGIYQKCAVCASLNCKYPHSEEISNVGLRSKELKIGFQESEDIINESELFQNAMGKYEATVQDLMDTNISECSYLEIGSKTSFIEELCDKKDNVAIKKSKTLIEDITDVNSKESDTTEQMLKLQIENASSLSSPIIKEDSIEVNSTKSLIEEIFQFCEEECNLEVIFDPSTIESGSSANITDELEIPENELFFYTVSESPKLEVAGKYKNIPVNSTNPNPSGSQIKIFEINQPINKLVIEEEILLTEPATSYQGVLKTIEEKCKAIYYTEPKLKVPKVNETKSDVIERILKDPNRSNKIDELNFTIGAEVCNVNEMRMKKFREDNDRIKKIIDTVYEQRELYNKKIDAIHTELENIRDDCTKIVSGLHKADELLNGDEIRNFDELDESEKVSMKSDNDSEIHISELPDFIKEIDEYQTIKNERRIDRKVVRPNISDYAILNKSNLTLKGADEEIIDEGIKVTNFIQNEESDNFGFQWLKNIYNSGIFTPSENDVDDEDSEYKEESIDASVSEIDDVFEPAPTDFSYGIDVKASEFGENTNYEIVPCDPNLKINKEETAEDLEFLQKIVSSNKDLLLNHKNPDAREFAKTILEI